MEIAQLQTCAFALPATTVRVVNYPNAMASFPICRVYAPAEGTVLAWILARVPVDSLDQTANSISALEFSRTKPLFAVLTEAVTHQTRAHATWDTMAQTAHLFHASTYSPMMTLCAVGSAIVALLIRAFVSMVT